MQFQTLGEAHLDVEGVVEVNNKLALAMAGDISTSQSYSVINVNLQSIGCQILESLSPLQA